MLVSLSLSLSVVSIFDLGHLILFVEKELLREPMKSAFNQMTYADAKAKAVGYDRVKHNFRRYLAQHTWGEWVNKPKEKMEAFYV